MRWASSLVIVSALYWPVLADAAEISEDRAEELVNLVRQDCGSCHGMTLKGGLGTSLLPGDLKEATAEELAEIILEGVPGKPMPPWKDLLTEQDANWIANALKTGVITRGNRQ